MRRITPRRTACELLKQLHTAEVQTERTRRRRWEAALARWCTLRSEHAVQLYVERLASRGFAEPPERLQLYRQLRAAQEEAAAKLRAHLCTAAPAMLPPGTAAGTASAWGAGAAALCSEWEAKAGQLFEELERLEARVDEKVGTAVLGPICCAGWAQQHLHASKQASKHELYHLTVHAPPTRRRWQWLH